MHAKYTADPATWTVPKLASAFGVSQPRVQAILLLTEWEKKDREIGKLTEEDELLDEDALLVRRELASKPLLRGGATRLGSHSGVVERP